MAMVKVTSEIRNLPDAGEPETASSVCAATYRETDGGFCLSYVEHADGGDVATEVCLAGDTVTVDRKGAVVCRMVFAEGKTETSLYEIPPYRFDMSLRTRRIRFTKSAGRIRLDLYYDMTVGGADKDVRLSMDVRGGEI